MEKPSNARLNRLIDREARDSTVLWVGSDASAGWARKMKLKLSRYGPATRKRA